MAKLEEWEIKKYWEIFSGLKPVNNKLSGDQVSVVLKNSKLSEDKLAKIWDLSDIDVDGSLDFEEFCICMRLIFDLVNGTITQLPDTLPDWLIPSSKLYLVQANKAVLTNNNHSSDEDEELSLGSDFDWYISPGDKLRYEEIYSSASDKFGRITFNSLNGLYSSLRNVPETDVRSAWNLVNPRQSETIDKDQVLVFLHMLNQRENGKRIPRGVPAALRATFSKETPEYNIDSHQANISTSNHSTSKASFGDNYLERIGGSNFGNIKKGTDFSSTEGTDWEEVRLKRELKQVEEELAKAEEEAKRTQNERNGTNNELLKIKREFQQLLEYKQKQLVNGSKLNDLDGINADISTVESQVEVLEQYLNQKKTELEQLKREVV